MTGFLEIFEPGLRHWREHQDREKMLVVTDEAGGAGPDPLDLDSGSVVLQMPSDAPDDPKDGSDDRQS